MTVQDLLNGAAKALGKLELGQQLNADELSDGFYIFNRMVDSSNTTKANIFTEPAQLVSTAADVQTYTFGPGGVWGPVRPQKIVQANFLLPTSPVVRRPMAVVDRQRWGSFRLQAIFTYPQALYYDFGNVNGVGTVWLRPIPDAVYQIELYTWLLNAKATSLTTSIAYPPGYEEFWLYNLAERLAGPLKTAIPQDVKDFARASRMNIARLNMKSPRIESADYGSGGGDPGGFNYYSGEPA